jgi:hypothetical protein
MPSITFDRFDGGLMLARPSSVSPSNSLSYMCNMDVQPGGWLRSRPKWRPSGVHLGAEWKGLESNAGYLWTFAAGDVASAPAAQLLDPVEGVRLVYALLSIGTGGALDSRGKLLGVTKWQNGFFAALSSDGSDLHAAVFAVNTTTHAVTATAVTDVNCPKTGVAVTLASRVFSVSDDGQTVRFCAVGDPTDWTTSGDAGFLPISQHFGSGQRAYALGAYQGKLAVFTDQSIQLWTVDPDPTAMAIDRVVDGVGTRHHSSIISLYGDLLFLSESGVRSLTTLSNALFPSDVDIGLPINRATPSPFRAERFSNGSTVPSVIALAASPLSQYWVTAPEGWRQ